MAAKIGLGALAILVVSTAMLVENTAATTYIVGDSLGWRVPPNGSADYANWASQHTFTVGDVLVFNYPTGLHNVARVTKAAFDACNATSPILLITIGPTNITLNSTGEEYFLCTFAQHCLSGQKLAINVTAATSPSPSPAPSPEIPPSPSPVPTPSPIPSPPPSPVPTPSPISPPSPSPSPSTSPPSPPSPPSPSPTPGGGGGGAPPSPPSPGTPSPESAPPPGSALPPPPGSVSPPPPPPNSAPATPVGTIFVILISAAIGIMC